MTEMELWMQVASMVGLLLGAWGIIWSRSASRPARIACGRAIFVAVLLALGAGSVVASLHCLESLVSFGLTSSFLVVGMLWDGPPSMWDKPRLPVEYDNLA